MNSFISMEKDRANSFEKEIEKLFKVKGKVQEIMIISAYFDLKALNWIEKYSKKNKDIKIQIFIDRYSSKFFSNDEIYDELIKVSKNIEIFLVKSGKLFHSKLYYIKSNKEIKVSIGSLNFTYNAFQKNEEILNEYIEDINKKSKYIEDIEIYINSLTNTSKSEKITNNLKNNHINNNLRSLLLDGFIYYESKEQESFSFKLKLPNDLKKIDTDIDSTLEANIVDSLTLERLVKESPILKEIKFPKKDKSQSRWKDKCIETCYGYWSPSFFNDDLEVILKKRKDKREPYFDRIKKLLKEHESELEKAFFKVRKKIIKRLNKSYWEYKNKSKAKEAWKDWRERLLNKFDNNNTFYKRLVEGVSKTSTPDVWGNDIESEEFENSFLDSLIYHWSKDYYNQKSTSNKIANIIAHNLKGRNENFDKLNINSEELKKEIEAWLSKYNNIFKERSYS